MGKREFSDDERRKGAKFKQCIADNGYDTIADVLTDEASYDMMYCLNWLAAGPLNEYNEFNKQYEIAIQLSNDGHKQMMDEFQSSFLSRAKFYLELSSKDAEFTQKNLVPFAGALMNMYCNPESLQAIFAAYFAKDKVKVNQNQ